jgi:hypothetical protein
MGKILRAVFGEEPKGPAERVLERCGRRPTIDCWTSPAGALVMAVYLEQHGTDGKSPDDKTAKLRIAYTSFHPEAISFTRSYECEGGSVERHDTTKVFKIAAGRTEGRRWRTARVPSLIEVERDADESQIEAEIAFISGSLQPTPGGITQFSVLFEGAADCSCC